MTSTAPDSKFRRVLHSAALHSAALLLVLLPALAPAASSPSAGQPVEVRADHATFEQKAGTGVYQGNAEMIQGNRHLYADTIRLFAENGRLVRVVATGNPVHMVEGDQFDATAEKLVYNLKTHELVLTGNAHIKHQGNTFEGARVEYNLDSKRVDASGNGDKRVRLVIPAQTEAQLKNGKPAPRTPDNATPGKTPDKTPASPTETR